LGFDVFQAQFVKIRGAVDVTHPNDNMERAHFGAEFSFFDRLFLRGGYKLNYDDQKFAFGAGAKPVMVRHSNPFRLLLFTV
jgi:hypothetical protein